MTPLKKFSEKWCHPERPVPRVSEGELNSVENEFGIFLPSDYREQVLSVGLPSPTLALLAAQNDATHDQAIHNNVICKELASRPSLNSQKRAQCTLLDCDAHHVHMRVHAHACVVA